MFLPVRESTARCAAGGHDHLHDIAHARDAEPDERAEIGQNPPVLRVDEGAEGRDKADEDLQPVADGAVEVAHAAAAAEFVGRMRAFVRHIEAAKIGDVALPAVADLRMLGAGRPVTLLFHAQAAAPGQTAEKTQKTLQRAGIFRFGIGDVFGNGHMQGNTHVLRILTQGRNGAPGQGFRHHQPHAVAAHGA